MMDESERNGRDDSGPCPLSHHVYNCGLSFLDPSVIVMDEQVFSHSMCQRVYQYLRRHMGGLDLDSFSFINNVEGSKMDCLKIFLQ